MSTLLDLPRWLVVAGSVALLVVLGRGFLRSRNVGYLLLLFGLVVWPAAVDGWLDDARRSYVDGLVDGGAVPFGGEVSVGQVSAALAYALQLPRLVLLVIGFVLIGRAARAARPVGLP